MGESNVLECDRCAPDKLTEIQCQKISSVLPSQYVHRICKYRDEATGFWLVMHLSLLSQEDAKQWWKEFQESSLTTMRVGKTFRVTGLRNIFKIYLHCQHNVKQRKDRGRKISRSQKHTECPAFMRIVVKRVVRRSRARKDPHLPVYPMRVEMQYTHNHKLRDDYSLGFRTVDPSTNDLFRSLFRVGHSAMTAHTLVRWQRWAEHGPNFEQITLDRAFNPDLEYVYRLFYITLKDSEQTKRKRSQKDAALSTEMAALDEVGIEAKRRRLEGVHRDEETVPESTIPDEGMIDDIESDEGLNFVGHGIRKRIKGKNRKRVNTIDHKQLYSDLEQFVAKHTADTNPLNAKVTWVGPNSDVAIAICTPIMLRAHTMTSLSGEMCVMDSTNQSFGQSACFLISIMAPSTGGGLPLGFIVLTSLAAAVIRQGFELLKSLLPENCFGGRGHQGPAVIFTDDSSLKPEFLTTIFPQSTILVSGFHVLQSTWRWMIDTRHKIPGVDRLSLLSIIKNLVCSETPQGLDEAHSRIINGQEISRYPEFYKFISEHILSVHHSWALTGLPSMPRCTASTLWEEAMYALRDRISLRGKIYNILQITHFMLTTADQCYQRNLSHSFSDQEMASYIPLYLERYIDTDGIHPINMYEYAVPSKGHGGVHTVNLDLGICSCHVGKSGMLCAHLAAVTKVYNLPWHLKKPFTCLERKFQVHRVATGKKMLQEQVQDVCSNLIKAMEADPKTIQEPLQSFVNSFSDVETSADLAKKLNWIGHKVETVDRGVGVTEVNLEGAGVDLGQTLQTDIGADTSIVHQGVRTKVRIQPERRVKSVFRGTPPGEVHKITAGRTWQTVEPSSSRPIMPKDSRVVMPQQPVIVPSTSMGQPIMLQNASVVIVNHVFPSNQIPIGSMFLVQPPANQSAPELQENPQSDNQMVPPKEDAAVAPGDASEVPTLEGKPGQGRNGEENQRKESVDEARTTHSLNEQSHNSGKNDEVSHSSECITSCEDNCSGNSSTVVSQERVNDPSDPVMERHGAGRDPPITTHSSESAPVSQPVAVNAASDRQDNPDPQGDKPMNGAEFQKQPFTSQENVPPASSFDPENGASRESVTRNEELARPINKKDLVRQNLMSTSQESLPHAGNTNSSRLLTSLRSSDTGESGSATAHQQYGVADIILQPFVSRQNVMTHRTQPIAVQQSGMSPRGQPVMSQQSSLAYSNQPIVSQQSSVAHSNQPITLQHSGMIVTNHPITTRERSMIYAHQPIMSQQTMVRNGDCRYPLQGHVSASSESLHPPFLQGNPADPGIPPITTQYQSIRGNAPIGTVHGHMSGTSQPMSVQHESMTVVNQPVALQHDDMMVASQPMTTHRGGSTTYLHHHQHQHGSYRT